MRIKNNCITALMLAVLFLFAFITGGGIGNAYAAVNSYSEVLEDLEKDENFNGSQYVRNDSDYSLQVFQIAESTAGELFIYVYQPSSTVVDLRATTVRLSQTIGDNLSPRDYNLALISKYNVFYKYKVEDIKVSSAAVRYYDITAIHRKYIDGKDDKPTDDNTISEVPYAVGQLWTVTTTGDGISYSMKGTDYVTITEKYLGRIRYSNGFYFYDSCCDSWLLAFSTNRNIDELMSVDISYSIQSCIKAGAESCGKPIKKTISVYGFENGSSRADKWFAYRYTWKRIERISEFLENEEADLNSDFVKNFKSMQWVIRFAETDYRSSSGILGVTDYYSKISDVTLLRLAFRYEGKPYNLGVVDNKQTGYGQIGWGGKLDGNNWPWWVYAIIVLVVLAILLPVLSLVFPIVGQVLKFALKALWLVVSAPFRFIAWVFKKIFKRE